MGGGVECDDVVEHSARHRLLAVARVSLVAIIVAASSVALNPSASGAEPEIDGPIVMGDDSGVYVWDGNGDAELVAGSSWMPRWSPDGTMIVLTHDGRIWAMNPDGSGGRYITYPDFGQWDGSHTFRERDYGPAWSPDGEWIVFMRQGQVYPLPGGDTTDTWLLGQTMFKVRLDGSDLTELAELAMIAVWDGEAMSGPVWSPDGELIAFRFISHTIDIVTITSAGSNWTNLTEAYRSDFSVWGYPSWSLLGDRIIFAATSAGEAREQEGIWMVDRDGTSPIEVIAPVGGAMSFPQLEHDGQSIIYRQWISSECALYRHAIGSGTPTLLYTGPGCSTFNLWPLTAGFSDESGSFTDDDGNTFELDIEWMAAEGITKGCNPPTNDRFCPADYVTRGQMAAFLVRALGLTDDGGGDLFNDDNDSIFEGDIDKLAAAGITKGCNPPLNDLFCPDSNVTRGQMAAFLVRALSYTDSGDGDLFVDDDDSIFERDIDRLATAGVTKGCNPPANDRFCPTAFVTRSQMAAFLHRALG